MFFLLTAEMNFWLEAFWLQADMLIFKQHPASVNGHYMVDRMSMRISWQMHWSHWLKPFNVINWKKFLIWPKYKMIHIIFILHKSRYNLETNTLKLGIDSQKSISQINFTLHSCNVLVIHFILLYFHVKYCNLIGREKFDKK
jgi:hypothetical protein